MSRIFWTDAEVEVIVNRAIEKRWPLPELSELDAIRFGQKQLPESRRRTILQYQHGKVAIEALRKEVARRKQSASTLKIQAEAAPQLPPKTRFDEALETIAEELTQRIAGEVAKVLRAALGAAERAAIKAATSDIQFTGRERRKRVLVVGPIPEQQGRLRTEFGDSIDLKFVASDEAPKRVAEIAPGCDQIVLWTKFMSHAHQENAPREKTIFVGGGVEELRTAIRSIL